MSQQKQSRWETTNAVKFRFNVKFKETHFLSNETFGFLLKSTTKCDVQTYKQTF